MYVQYLIRAGANVKGILLRCYVSKSHHVTAWWINMKKQFEGKVFIFILFFNDNTNTFVSVLKLIS